MTVDRIITVMLGGVATFQAPLAIADEIYDEITSRPHNFVFPRIFKSNMGDGDAKYLTHSSSIVVSRWVARDFVRYKVIHHRDGDLTCQDVHYLVCKTPILISDSPKDVILHSEKKSFSSFYDFSSTIWVSSVDGRAVFSMDDEAEYLQYRMTV